MKFKTLVFALFLPALLIATCVAAMRYMNSLNE